MSNLEGSDKSARDGALGAIANVDPEVDQVIVESGGYPALSETATRRSPAFALPLVLGLVFLIANIYLITRTPAIFLAKNSTGGTSLLLMIASIVFCLILIGYAFSLLRAEGGLSAKAVGVALLLGLLAPLSTVWSLQVNRSANDRAVLKPCIDIYEQAQSVARDNPRFRMPASDREERRCSVNAVLGR